MAPEKPTDDSRLRQTSGGSEDKTPNGGYAKTSMIVRIELPALSKATQVHFALEPSKSKRVLDGLAEFVRDIPRKWNDELLDLDTDSSETQLEVLRQEVLVDLDSWNMKVKAAEEWKRKVDHAAANMNKMRDAYYRELFHLREQVYRQDKANKEGTAFLPTYALHFDPSEYHVEDEVRLAVAAKVALLEQEFQTKHDEQEVKHGARVRSLNEQLVVSKMSLSRKDKLLEKLKLKHGWDNQQLKDMLEAQKIDEEKLRANIEAKAQQAEQLAAVAFKELSSKQDSAEDVNDEVQKLRGFLERKHGSIKDAIVQIKLTSDVDARMGLAEFQKWAEQISYVTETKRAFVHLCGASPFTSLRDIFDRLARPAPKRSSTGGAMTRRRSAAAELEGVRRNLTESHDPDVSSEPAAIARRRSIDGAIDVSASRIRRALGRRHSMGSLGKIVEGEQITMDTAMSLTAGSAIGSDSDSDLMSDAGSELSDFSECASRVSGTKSDTSHRMPKVLGRAGSNIGLKSMVSCEVATDVSLASGIEAAFSSTNSLLKRDTADAGCDARPYEASFGKRPLKTRAVQSQIDRTMLESAIQVITAVGVESLDEASQSYASGVATSRSAARARSPRGSSRTTSMDLDAAGLEADDGAGADGVVDEDPPPSPTTSAKSPKRRKAAARAAPSAAGDGGDARQTGEGAEPEEGPEAEGAARPGPARSSEAASPRWAGASRDADLGAPSDEPPPGRHTFGGALGARREPQAELRTTFINADDLPVGSGPERTLAGTTYRKIRAGTTDPGREFVTDHILGLSGPALPKRTPVSRSAIDSQMQEEEGDADGGLPSLQRTVALTARRREGMDSCPVQRLARGAKRRVCPSEQAGASASELREGSDQDDDAALAPGWSGLVPRVSFSSRMVETARQISPGTERQASPGIERQASVDGVEDLLGAGVLGSARTSSPPSRQICRNLAAQGVRKVPSKEVLLDAEAGGPAERRTEPGLRSARTMPLERGRPAASMAFARGLASPGRAADAGGDAGGDAGSDCDSLPDTGCVVDLLLERPHAKVPRGVLPAEPICSPRVRRLRGMPSGSSSAAFSRQVSSSAAFSRQASDDCGGSLLPPMASQMLDLPDSAGVECRVSATTPSSGPMSARVSFRRTVGNVFYRPEKQQPDAGKTSRTALPEVSRLKRMASAEKLDAGPSPPLALASARQRAVAEDPADLPQRATFHGVFPVREPAVSRRPPGSSSDFRQSRGKMLFDASR